MSHKINTEIMEQKGEMFDEAVSRGDYETALAIARDYKDAGFGLGLLEELRSLPLDRFTNKSFLQPHDL